MSRIQNIESDFRDRLVEAIAGEPVAAFGRRCGTSESLLRGYLKNGNKPGLDHLVAIADTANVNIEWLATGRGPKQRGDTTPYVPTDADGIPQRIRMWRESLRMTQGEFGAVLDLSVFPVQNWEAGEKRPDAKDLAVIAETGANIDWLRTGKGEMRSGLPMSRMIEYRMGYITPNSLNAELDSASEPPASVITPDKAYRSEVSVTHAEYRSPEIAKLMMRISMSVTRATWLPTTVDDEDRMAIANIAVDLLIASIKGSPRNLIFIMQHPVIFDQALRLAYELFTHVMTND